MAILFLGALLACGGAGTAEPTPASSAAPTVACVAPESFGAVADDGLDDRVPLQQAMVAAADRGLPLCLPRGTLNVSRRPGAIASLVMPSRPLTLRGMGAASRLVALPQFEDIRHDWWILQVSGAGHVLSDFAIDASNRGITGEQTHLIQILGPARDLRLEGLRLTIPMQAGNDGGDCIRLLGDPGRVVEDVVLRRIVGVECERSFIALQRQVRRVLIEEVASVAVGGQAIDMEPTGPGAIDDVVIRRSRLLRGRIAKGGYTVSLAGSRSRPSTNLALEDNVIEAGVQVYRVHHASIIRNEITGGFAGRGLLKLQQDTQYVSIVGNHLRRSRGEGAGIELNLHHGTWPQHVTIRDNVIEMAGPGYPVHAEPAVSLVVEGNDITCHPDARAAIYLRGVGAAVASVEVRGNLISGGCHLGVRISAHGEFVTGATLIEDNVVDGAVGGVLFENGAPGVPARVRGNRFEGVPPAAQVVIEGTRPVLRPTSPP